MKRRVEAHDSTEMRGDVGEDGGYMSRKQEGEQEEKQEKAGSACDERALKGSEDDEGTRRGEST